MNKVLMTALFLTILSCGKESSLPPLEDGVNNGLGNSEDVIHGPICLRDIKGIGGTQEVDINSRDEFFKLVRTISKSCRKKEDLNSLHKFLTNKREHSHKYFYQIVSNFNL